MHALTTSKPVNLVRCVKRNSSIIRVFCRNPYKWISELIRKLGILTILVRPSREYHEATAFGLTVRSCSSSGCVSLPLRLLMIYIHEFELAFHLVSHICTILPPPYCLVVLSFLSFFQTGILCYIHFAPSFSIFRVLSFTVYTAFTPDPDESV